MAQGKVPADWREALESAAVAELVAEDIKRRAKEVLKEDPDAIPGYQLLKGRAVYSVADTRKALDQLEGILPENDLMACTKVMWGKLLALYGETASLTGARRLGAISAILGDNLKEAITAPILRRKADPENKLDQLTGHTGGDLE